MDTIMYPYTLVLGFLLEFGYFDVDLKFNMDTITRVRNAFWMSENFKHIILCELWKEDFLPNMPFGTDPRFKLTTSTGGNSKMRQYQNIYKHLVIRNYDTDWVNAIYKCSLGGHLRSFKVI